MEEGAVPSIEELKKLKVVELKARLSSLGLHTSGRGIKQSNLFSLMWILCICGLFWRHESYMMSYDPRAHNLNCVTLSSLLWLGLQADLIERLHSYFLSVSAFIHSFSLLFFFCITCIYVVYTTATQNKNSYPILTRCVVSLQGIYYEQVSRKCWKIKAEPHEKISESPSMLSNILKRQRL